MKVHITQGDTEDVDLAETMGTGQILDIPDSEPVGQPVDVNMQFDAQGRLHVSAVYVNTGQLMELHLDIPGGLKEEEIREHREYMQRTSTLSVFDPDRALAGLDEDYDD